MPRQTLRVDAPFTGGVVTDTPPGRLRADQTPYAENMVVSEGVAVERGGWTYVGEDDPVTASTGALSSCIAVRFEGRDEHDLMVSTDDGMVGVATDGANGRVFADAAGTVYYPRAVYKGEVIWCPQDGVSPIRRTVDCTSTVTTGTGTFDIAQGETRVEGTSTNFDPHVPVGSYIASGLYRVVARQSDTQLAISEEPDTLNTTGRPTDPQTYGVIGLKTLVTDKGVATHSAASSTFTGVGTAWASETPGNGEPAVGDWFAEGNMVPALVRFPQVTAVGGDTSITTTANTTGAFTETPYAILRNAVGREACSHRNTLYIAGVKWAEDRLYHLPLDAGLGAIFNPGYSNVTEVLDSAQLNYVDIPSRGQIVALTSSREALYVHKTDSLHRVTGEWPALNVQKVADYGTREIRAALSVDEGVFFAGTEGVFALRGDSLDNLCEERGRRGGRLSEWRQQITRSTRCVVGVVRGHLYISTGNATRECWVYDIRNDRWCGNFTSESGAVSGIEGATYMDSARDVILDPVLEDVGRDRLLMVTDSTTTLRIGDVSTTIPDNPGGGVEVDDENLGRFRADTPTNIAGAIARQKRVAGVKVGYVLAGDDAMTLDVDSNVDEAATSALEVELPSGDAYDVETVRIPPTTGYIGRLGRSFQLSFRRSASPTASSRVAVHFLELVVGERRPRA